MRISDWSSDVCSSDLAAAAGARCAAIDGTTERLADYIARPARRSVRLGRAAGFARGATRTGVDAAFRIKAAATGDAADGIRSEEHTSELPSLMRISYAVFCLKKKNTIPTHTINT